MKLKFYLPTTKVDHVIDTESKIKYRRTLIDGVSRWELFCHDKWVSISLPSILDELEVYYHALVTRERVVRKGRSRHIVVL